MVLGGALGQYIEEQIETTRIKQAFFKIKGETRNCIAILHEGQQTEILEKGPTIELKESEEFKSHLLKLSKKLMWLLCLVVCPKDLILIIMRIL